MMDLCIVQHDNRSWSRESPTLMQQIHFEEVDKPLPIDSPLKDRTSDVSIHGQRRQETDVWCLLSRYLVLNSLAFRTPAVSVFTHMRVNAAFIKKHKLISTILAHSALKLITAFLVSFFGFFS